MAAKVSPTLRVLREIRDRVDSLEERMVAQNAALATEVVAVATAVVEVRDLLADRLNQRDRIDNHELRIRELERRTG